MIPLFVRYICVQCEGNVFPYVRQGRPAQVPGSYNSHEDV
jgi:hypothetical protein